MGTLDDAIREHLELKRRAGSPEEEVRRLEHEAFGPARSAAPAEPDVPPAAPDQPVQTPSEPAAIAASQPQPQPPEPEPQAAEPPPPAEPPAARRAEPEPWLDEPDEVPSHDTLEHRRPGTEPPEDYVAPDEEGEDLLEETPDFLQETPEHDRLWFEQKPPRDFDFDS